jgi:hypothetical protein
MSAMSERARVMPRERVERIERIENRKAITVRLSAELLGAPNVVLVAFDG